ncbi:MAG: 50S ribosomal protein L22 [bacterium]|nr:50S ribosomal protein L22 [bacterium]
MVEIRAKLKQVRISPKKMRLVAGAIRGLDVNVALDKLPIIFKKSSPVIEKLLRSAVANAIDRYDVSANDLKIKSIVVDKGIDLKRFRPAAFGRAHPFKKHSAHVEIVLVTKDGVKVASKEKKVADLETVDLTKTKQTDNKEAKGKVKETKVKEVKESKSKVSQK